MKAELERLMEIARKATPGPYAVEDPLPYTLSIVEAGKPTYEWRFIADCSMPDEDDHDFTSAEVKANATYIAAFHPQIVIALQRVAAAAGKLTVAAEQQLYPTPDKPNTSWSKARATREALDELAAVVGRK